MATRWKWFAVVAGTVVVLIAGGLRLSGGAAPEPAPQPLALQAADSAAGRSQGSPLAPAAPAAPPPTPIAAAATPPARLRLAGVVSPRSDDTGRAGVALISLNGLAPKAYRIGDTVANDLVLLTAWRRGATLGPAGGPASLALEIAPPPGAADGAAAASAATTTPFVAGGAGPQPASPATREAVPVTDPEHGVDTSNR